MTPTLRTRLVLFTLLAALMAATRMNHFGAMPDASWAVFFLGGAWLARDTRWAFPALMALAVLVDYLVIRAAGLDFWSHYCVSPGYWFLLPAHLSLWAGGALLRRLATLPRPAFLAGGAVLLVASVALCHLFAQGGTGAEGAVEPACEAPALEVHVQHAHRLCGARPQGEVSPRARVAVDVQRTEVAIAAVRHPIADGKSHLLWVGAVHEAVQPPPLTKHLRGSLGAIGFLQGHHVDLVLVVQGLGRE